MKKHYRKLFFIVLVAIFWSCVHEPFQGLPDEGTPDDIPGSETNVIVETNQIPCDPDSAYFANDILPIFISSCAISGCHDAESHVEDLVLNSYANIRRGIKPGDPNESKYFKVMTLQETDDLMPQDPATGEGYYLPQEQLDLIRLWINQGAQNNSCSSCDTTNVQFSAHILPIVQVSCSTSSGCHGTGSSNGVLLNYQDIKTMSDNGSLRDRVLNKMDMPPGGGLTDCDISLIRIWLDNGSPNN